MPPDFQPGGFSCGQEDVDHYMHAYAVSDQVAGVTRSYLVRDGDAVVAYISVLCDAIHLHKEERPTDHPGAPALKIGLMGVRADYRGRVYAGEVLQKPNGPRITLARRDLRPFKLFGRRSLAARIPESDSGDPGSIPGAGTYGAREG